MRSEIDIEKGEVWQIKAAAYVVVGALFLKFNSAK